MTDKDDDCGPAFEHSTPGDGEIYHGLPPKLHIKDPATYVQPWSGFDPPCTLEDPTRCKDLPSQTFNLKLTDLYEDIQVEFDPWVKMACDEATENVRNGGRPFGAVVIQVDDETNEILRYWKARAQVYAWDDPTAHAEIVAIRAACRELGVWNLGKITNGQSKLPQKGETSRCLLFASTESCPMCQAAMFWAGIPTAVFGATRYDAEVQGTGINQSALYTEMSLPYRARKTVVRQSSVPNSLDAYNLLKRSPKKTG